MLADFHIVRLISLVSCTNVGLQAALGDGQELLIVLDKEVTQSTVQVNEVKSEVKGQWHQIHSAILEILHIYSILILCEEVFFSHSAVISTSVQCF